MAATGPALGAVVSVLDLAPELGCALGEGEMGAARQACRGALVRVSSGRWEPSVGALDGQRWMALVIVSGAICREIGLRDRHLLELLGAGDVLQLPVHAERRLGSDVTLTAVAKSELLILGVPFLRAAARWPSLMIELHRRLEAQREELAVQALIAHLPRAEHRLLLMLWHLADRWGVVTPDGIVIQLPLSHDLLGQLAAARRPTATLALSQLEDRGEIQRLRNGFWLLTPAAERAVGVIASTHETGHSFGEILASRVQSTATSDQARALRAQAEIARIHQPRRDRPAVD